MREEEERREGKAERGEREGESVREREWEAEGGKERGRSERDK